MTEDSIETVTLWQGNGHTYEQAERRLVTMVRYNVPGGVTNRRIVESYPTGEFIIMGDVAAQACLERAR